MATITASVLAQAGSTSNTTSYATASVTLTAGRCYLIAIENTSGTAGIAAPTAVQTTGGAIAFTKIADFGFNTSASPLNRMSVWRVVAGSTVTATITITTPSSTGCAWTLVELTGDVNFGTPIVSGSIVSSVPTTASSVSITPNAKASSRNAIIGFWGGVANSTADAPSGTGWSNLGTGASYNTPTTFIEAAFNTTTANALTASGAGSVARGLVVMEVAATPFQVTTEALGLSDVLLIARGWVLEIGEFLGMAEGLITVVAAGGGSALIKLANEALGLTEGALHFLGLRRLKPEALGLTEITPRAGVWVRLKTEALGLTEVAQRAASFVRLRAEALGITETVTRTLGRVRVMAEALGLTESTRLLRGLARVRAEAIGLAETVGHIGGIVRSKAEALGITESLTHLTGLLRQRTEALGITEAPRRLLALVRIQADLLGITESVRRLASFIRTRTETLGLGEAVLRAAAFVRAQSEAIGLTEQPRRALALIRSVLATLGIGEAVRSVLNSLIGTGQPEQGINRVSMDPTITSAALDSITTSCVFDSLTTGTDFDG